MTTHSTHADATFDFDGLLRANLEQVFNERDDTKRAAAIAALYTQAPVMYEPSRPVHGQDAISRVASDLLKQFEKSLAEGGARHSPQSKSWFDRVKSFFE